MQAYRIFQKISSVFSPIFFSGSPHFLLPKMIFYGDFRHNEDMWKFLTYYKTELATFSHLTGSQQCEHFNLYLHSSWDTKEWYEEFENFAPQGPHLINNPMQTLLHHTQCTPINSPWNLQTQSPSLLAQPQQSHMKPPPPPLQPLWSDMMSTRTQHLPPLWTSHNMTIMPQSAPNPPQPHSSTRWSPEPPTHASLLHPQQLRQWDAQGAGANHHPHITPQHHSWEITIEYDIQQHELSSLNPTHDLSLLNTTALTVIVTRAVICQTGLIVWMI